MGKKHVCFRHLLYFNALLLFLIAEREAKAPFFPCSSAFAPTLTTRGRRPVSFVDLIVNKKKWQTTTGTCTLHQHAVGQHVISTTFAGKVWPIVKKLHIGPEKASNIWKHVAHITHWQDVVFLLLVAYATLPVTKLFWERQRISQNEEEDDNVGPRRREWVDLRRRQVATVLAGGAKVALSVYAVDVLCVALTSIGFGFPSLWDIPGVYSKVAYSYWGLRRFLEFKTKALCRLYKVDKDNMGKVEILDRFITGLSVSMVSLLLFDWLSVRMGMALKGLVAFGSVGTLAFTFASQDLVSQFISGIFLTASSKVYPGDDVLFGDGTKGKILKMGWMDTVIRASDNSIMSVPNSKLANQKVSNLSRVQVSQVAQTLRFHYEDADEIPALVESIKKEIQKECSLLITDGTRPFRVFWTGFKEDHLEVMVDAHFRIPPIGDSYWINRQKVLVAINRAVKSHNLDFAKLAHAPTGEQQPPVWRVVPLLADRRQRQPKPSSGTLLAGRVSAPSLSIGSSSSVEAKPM